MRLRIAVLMFLLFSTVPLFGESGNRYFSLSTNQTFAPGEKPSIHLYAHNTPVLEFRVYSVKDPQKFFAQFDDVHSFGPQESPKERIDTPSLLERFHDWKMSVWRWVRSFFHDQFSAEARDEIKSNVGNKVQHMRIVGEAGFANVPILNSTRLVSRWKAVLPPSYVSESSDLPLDSLDSGVYLVEATDGTYKAYTVIIVTKLVVAVKSSSGHLLVFAADRASGAPVAGVTVTTWLRGHPVVKFTTDAQGVGESRVTAPAEAVSSASLKESEWVLAQSGKDVALVAPNYFSFNLSSNPDNDLTSYVYTDRPVYRPGDSVQFKIILRRRDGDALVLPPSKEVIVKITNSDGDTLLQKGFTPNGFGTISGSIDLPRDAALGYYRINVGKDYAAGNFQVEEYKKPDYFVKVIPEKQRVLEGESFKAVIEARYYFGEPVTNAKVSYSVYITPSYYFEDEADDEEYPEPEASTTGGGDEGNANASDENEYYAGMQISEGKGTLDANGRLTVTIPTRSPSSKHMDYNYRIEANVTDNANRAISGTNIVLATSGTFHLSVQAQSYVYHQGDNAQFTVHAVDYDKHPVSTKVAVEMLDPHDKVIGQSSVTTDAKGMAQFSMPVTQRGATSIHVTSESAGRVVEGRTWFWAAGAGETTWGDEETNSLKMIADKPSYKTGDVAHVLVLGVAKDATLLETTEGNNVLSHQVIRTPGGDVTVDVPITAECLPNAYVSVLFFENGKLYQGSVNLKVPPVERRLKIEITPSKPQFEPGESALYKIHVQDWSGKPVQAELSVGVVDDAIYAVEPDRSGDVVSAFYTDRSGVEISNSLDFYFHGEAGKKSVQLAEHRFKAGEHSRLAQVKASELVQPKVRKAFPDTAFWQAHVTTNAAGEAEVSLHFPDSLTTWRATVRAITRDTLGGWAVNRVLVRKNLMVRLAAPRFMRQGDSVTVSTLTHNYLDSAVSAHVSLDVNGAGITAGTAQTLNIASRGEGDARWTLRPNANATSVKLLAKSLTSVESDAMEMSLPIIPFGVRRTINESGVIGGANGQRDTAINFPTSEASSRGMDVELSPSVLGSLFSGLDYLTSFPYGCTEQTLSSFVPNVVVSMSMRDLKVKSTINPAVLKSQVEAGAERLYGYQHEDGGWGWWQEDDSTVYMTAYAVSGLSLAQRAGYSIREPKIKRGQEYLRRMLDQHPRMIADLQAYAVHALVESGYVEKGLLNDLWEKRSDLTSEGVAITGEAMLLAGDSRAAEAADMLRKRVLQEGDGSYWREQNDYLLDVYGDNSVEATAYAVKLLSKVAPNDSLLPRAVLWLMRHRNNGYYWESTKQTATVIYGVMEYLKASHELGAGFSATFTVNGRKVLTHKFTAADALSPTPVRVHLDNTQIGGANKITVQKSGNGRLYWSARGSYYSTEKSLYNNGSLSLNITREYFRLVPVNNGERITYNLVPLSGTVAVGDVIAVRLTVSGGEWRYLLVEDPIPAGTEFIPRSDLYDVNRKPSWWGWWYTRGEFHDDHAAFFRTHFSGSSEYFYLLRAINPGEFSISPATAQPMYQPEVLSSTEPAHLEVKQ